MCIRDSCGAAPSPEWVCGGKYQQISVRTFPMQSRQKSPIYQLTLFTQQDFQPSSPRFRHFCVKNTHLQKFRRKCIYAADNIESWRGSGTRHTGQKGWYYHTSAIRVSWQAHGCGEAWGGRLNLVFLVFQRWAHAKIRNFVVVSRHHHHWAQMEFVNIYQFRFHPMFKYACVCSVRFVLNLIYSIVVNLGAGL